MKKILLPVLALATVAAVLTSCKKDEITKISSSEQNKEQQNTANLVKKVFSAGPQSKLRTIMLSDGQLVWSEGDQLKIFTTDTPEGNIFTIAEGAGTPSAKFEGITTPTGPYVAAYPASNATSYDGTDVIMTIPAIQQYSSNMYASGTIPIVAYTDGDSFNFINVCQFIKVSLRATDGTVNATKIILESKTAEQMSGVFKINPQTGAMTYKSDVSSQITLECEGGVAIGSDSDVDFYFCVPAGTLTSGYRVMAVESDDTTGIMAESNADLSLDPGAGKSIGLTAIPVQISTYADVKPDYPEKYFKYRTFTYVGDEVIFKWEIERQKNLWFRPIIKMPAGGGEYRDMKYNDIVYNDVPWHFPHMYGYVSTGITETKVSTNMESDGRTTLTQNKTWGLLIANQYGDNMLPASFYYMRENPNPTLRNDGNVPKCISLQGKLIKTGEDARTVELKAGMNEVCNYNTKMLNLNKLKECNSDLKIYLADDGWNLSEIDTSVSNNIYPSYCFAIKSETAQTIVIPENCYTELAW